MFDYIQKEAYTTTQISKKDINQNPRDIIHICQKQDVRTTLKHLPPFQDVVQKKETAEYLNSISFDQARHHIIPDNTLKSFITKVKANDANTFRKLVAAVEASYITYHNITLEDLAEEQLNDPAYIRGLESTPRNKFLTLITYTKTNNPQDYYNDMEKAFVWSPGNLVIGPQRRGADPRDSFDSEAAAIAGIPLGTPRYPDKGIEPTGQMALGEAFSMMLYYIDGTINNIYDNIIDTILIPHIKRAITDGTSARWQ